MSHYTSVECQIKSTQALKDALVELGYTEIEESDVPLGLYGYHGDLRPEKANIVVRRKFVGGASNDIGFLRNIDGTWSAIVSDFDRGYLREKHELSKGIEFVQKVTQLSGVHAAMQQAARLGYRASRSTDSKGRQVVTINSGGWICWNTV